MLPFTTYIHIYIYTAYIDAYIIYYIIKSYPKGIFSELISMLEVHCTGVKKKSRGHCISKIVKWCGASRPLCGGMHCGIAPPFKSVSAAFPLNLQWCGSSRFFSQPGFLKNTSVTSIGNPWNAVSGQTGQQQLNCEWPLTTSCENLHKQSCTTRIQKRSHHSRHL